MSRAIPETPRTPSPNSSPAAREHAGDLSPAVIRASVSESDSVDDGYASRRVRSWRTALWSAPGQEDNASQSLNDPVHGPGKITNDERDDEMGDEEAMDEGISLMGKRGRVGKLLYAETETYLQVRFRPALKLSKQIS